MKYLKTIMELKDDQIRGIRTKDWPVNKKDLKFNQEVIEETVRNLKLIRCPICATNLESTDSAGGKLRPDFLAKEKYCPKDEYVIELHAHPYSGASSGTQLYMRIFTDTRNSQLIAASGKLADITRKIDYLP